MTSKLGLAAIIGLLLVASAAGSFYPGPAGLAGASAAATQTEHEAGRPASRGSKIFSRDCAGCHGANGSEGYAPNLRRQHLSATRILHIVTYGKGNMPGFGQKDTKKELADVGAFVRALEAGSGRR